VSLALGLLLLFMAVRDLLRGSTTIGGTPFSRESHPMSYWSFVLIYLGCGLLSLWIAAGA
jgi:hypothetical protein